MRPSAWLGMAIAASFGFAVGFAASFGSSIGLGRGSWFAGSSAQAVELQDGQIYFVHPPLLVDASTTRNTTLAWKPTYYFTLTVPDDAGESLSRVEIQQNDSSTRARRVDYFTDETRAFEGIPGDRGEDLSVGETLFDEDNQTVTVVLDPPVEPGTTVTIGLKPERNPRMSGVYLFGVTAYPSGESAYGQFLGYGQLQIYGNDTFPWF